LNFILKGRENLKMYFCAVKKSFILLAIVLIGFLAPEELSAQCAMCTKTASQLGEKPAEGLNSGIIYLMLAPFSIVGFIGYRWWKNNRRLEMEENS